MKVLLKEDVKNLGKSGDLVEVAEGHARNFLIPRGLAVKATGGSMKSLAQVKRTEVDKRERELERAKSLAARVRDVELVIYARSGDGKKLFGSVTAKDIAEGLGSILGVEIDKKKIDLHEPIKALGSYTVLVRLHAEVSINLKIRVVDSSEKGGQV